MSVITSIYNQLETDARLSELLAMSTIDPTKNAIYDEWADHLTPMPYIVLTFSFTASPDHWGKQETILNIDIFTAGDTVTGEDIKHACIFALDRQTIVDNEDGAYIRAYYNRDGAIPETTPDVFHINLEFSLAHWRNSFIREIE